MVTWVSKGQTKQRTRKGKLQIIFNITDCKFQSWRLSSSFDSISTSPSIWQAPPYISSMCFLYIANPSSSLMKTSPQSPILSVCILFAWVQSRYELIWYMCYVQSVFHKIHLHCFHFGAIQIWASPILSLCNSTKLHFLHKIDQFARKRRKKAISTIKNGSEQRKLS